MFKTKFTFDIMVETSQIHIAEQLACQVADRQTTSLIRIEKALIQRQSVPIRFMTFNLIIFNRIIKNDYFRQIHNQLIVQFILPADSVTIFPVRIFLHSTSYLLIQYPPVYTHKIPLQVQFKDKAWASVIVRTTSDMMKYSFHSI